MLLGGAFSRLIPLAAVTLFLVGFFRVVEVGADLLLRAAGAEAAAAAPVAGLAVVGLATAAIAALALRSRRQRSWGYNVLEVIGDAPSEDQKSAISAIEDFMEEQQPTPIQRVIGVGQSESVDRLTVELLAIEIREKGGRITLEVHDPEGRTEPQTQSGVAGHGKPDFDEFSLLIPILLLEDDFGTRYVTMEAGGGGQPGGQRYEILFAPAIPSAARRLIVTIDRLSDERVAAVMRPSREPRTIRGPWRFEVDLE